MIDDRQRIQKAVTMLLWQLLQNVNLFYSMQIDENKVVLKTELTHLKTIIIWEQNQCWPAICFVTTTYAKSETLVVYTLYFVKHFRL